jgi:hypothetical protein
MSVASCRSGRFRTADHTRDIAKALLYLLLDDAVVTEGCEIRDVLITAENRHEITGCV